MIPRRELFFGFFPDIPITKKEVLTRLTAKTSN
jgi:hypothetical protein